VRVRRVENGILLEPMVTDIDAWFAELDRFADVPFMEDGRRQPPMPELLFPSTRTMQRSPICVLRWKRRERRLAPTTF
jgi:hypothetical protein